MPVTSVKSDVVLNRERAIRQLAEIGGKAFAEEDIIFEGEKLIIPLRMNLNDAYKFIERKLQEDSESVRWHHTYNFRPWDGAVAATNAIKKAFGVVSIGGMEVKSLFGSQKIEPQYIDVPIDGQGNTVSVPWGQLMIPGLSDVVFSFDSTFGDLGECFVVHAKGPRARRFEVKGVFEIIEAELRTNSIYRGKAFDANLNFLDLRGVQLDKVVYSGDAREQLEANLWSLLRWTDQMERKGLPLKRTVVLEGPYGTGKTLGAYLTAHVAEENGWTFVLCRQDQNLEMAFQTARMYQPAVVFFEDVDTLAAATDQNINHMLDLMDGITTKGTKIISVLTTNHIDRLHKGVLRAGRIDSIIHIGELDDEGVRQLVTVTADGQLGELVDWDQVCAAMRGWLPAFVKEAVDRAIRYAMSRTQGKGGLLTTDDLVHAANGLKPQLDLMNEASEGERRPTLDTAVKDAVQSAVEHLRGVDNYGDDCFTFELPVASNGR